MYAKNSRFKHSGKTEIIVGAVVETMGTIKVAMKGSDVKEDIRYLIILHEASFWRKFDILNSTYHENNTNIESNGYIDNLWKKKLKKLKKKKKQLNNLPTGYVKTNTITNSFDRFQAKYN